ncbi:MAG TPA: transporter associated domain-containing protein [Steroidobacteraceae bacterium]|nr:transporter associated domain-containing protein [Steroidobacteraceae bacterium]
MAQNDGSATGRWLKRTLKSFSGEPQDREELMELLRDAHERGVVDADATRMLEGVLEVSDLQVRDIMVPRGQMVFVRRDDPPGRILPTVIESGHSRFPVMDENRDDIVGILLAKDLLRLAPQALEPQEPHERNASHGATRAAAAERFDIREYMRPAVFVPESKRLNVLLRDFRRGRNHMAIVVDEYGGVSGLVTIEDVIEEIVGEIEDEFDVEDDRNIRKEEPRQFTVRGVTRLEEFNEYFGTELSGDGFDTVAGLIMNRLGRLPRRGETLAIDGLEFRVVRADRRRIDTVRVVSARDVTPPDERAADGAE